MPSKKAKKQVERFRAGINKFVETFSLLVGAEVTTREESAHSGDTLITITLTPTKNGMPATRAAKLGSRMSRHFSAWFAPTHFEMYAGFDVSYKRGEGTIIVEGRI